MTQLTPDQADTVTRLAHLTATIAEMQEAADDLKTRLRAQLAPGEYTDQAGARRVTISPPARRFQPDLAERNLPVELLALCRVTKVDSAAARKVLPPALYEQCQAATGEPVIRLA